MQYTCIECKNTNEAELTVGQIVECPMCGITLEVRELEGPTLEIVDEGK